MKRWLSALHTAWSAAVAAASVQRYKYKIQTIRMQIGMGTLHWTIAWHIMGYADYIYLHRGTNPNQTLSVFCTADRDITSGFECKPFPHTGGMNT